MAAKIERPYICEGEYLFEAVEKYMRVEDEYEGLDVREMTKNIIAEVFRFRNKRIKAFSYSVKKVYEYKLQVLAQKSLDESTNKGNIAKSPAVKKDTLPPWVSKKHAIADAAAAASPNDDTPVVVSNGDTPKKIVQKLKNDSTLDAEIEATILKKKQKSVSIPKTSQKLIPLANIKGIKSLVKPLKLVMLKVKSGGSLTVQLTGPDRCGKTTLVDAMAAHMELPVSRIEMKDVLRGGPLSSPLKRMQEELAKAHENLPGVLLLHQVDLLYTRDSNSNTRQPELLDVAAEVLQYIRGINDNCTVEGPVLVVVETSRPELLEPQLRDCCCKKLVITAPGAADRTEILQYLCGDAVDIDLAQVALKASSFVAGDLKKLVREATTIASDRVLSEFITNEESFEGPCEALVELPEEKVTLEDLLQAANLITPGLKSVGFPAIPDTTWDDIGGLCDIRNKLRSCIVDPFKHPEEIENFGMKQSSGVLLWGPPGCGKTLLAKAVANEAGVNLLIVNGPELLSMYQGESERAVRTMFAKAASVAPCVIFFDEFDSLCPRRSKAGGESGSKSTIVNTLLTEMDGFLSRPGIYLMAATNLPSVLDPAVLRPGRFDTKLYVGLPDSDGRLAVLKAATKNGTKPRLASDVNLDDIAARVECNDFTGADCRHLVDTAINKAREEKETMIVNTKISSPENKKRPLESDESEISQSSKKMKSDENGSISETQNTEVCQNDQTDSHPDGMYAIYSRHFEAALAEVKPSVSDTERRKYEQQLEEF